MHAVHNMDIMWNLLFFVYVQNMHYERLKSSFDIGLTFYQFSLFMLRADWVSYHDGVL